MLFQRKAKAGDNLFASDADADAAEEALASKLADEPPEFVPDDVPAQPVAQQKRNKVYDLPPMPRPVAQQPRNKSATKPAITGQQLLDMVVAAVLEERIGVIEQDGTAYLTVLEQRDNVVYLRTLGQLRLGGVTMIRGSTVTK